MPNLSTAYITYQSIDLHTHVEGADAHELIDLLYKGVIDKLAKTKGHILHNNITEKGEETGKIISILTELKRALAVNENNEISEKLDSLYSYLIELTVTINVQNDLKSLDEASKLLNHIRESWNLIPVEQRH